VSEEDVGAPIAGGAKTGAWTMVGGMTCGAGGNMGIMPAGG
jgi:hypothetical protein